jgi:uncharacterized protein (DUF1778 family)
METDMARTSPSPRSDNINIRVTPETLGLIDRAASVAGKTRTAFILDTVKQAAEETILDQRLFVLDEAQWEAFIALLDAPPRPDERLMALLARRPSWET